MGKRKEKKESSPVIRVRLLGIGVMFLIALISGPLLAVWKQVYINNTSIQMNVLTDTISIKHKEIATLKFSCELYSSTERIEKIAKNSLNLEYPVSSQIVIVRMDKKKPNRIGRTSRDILAYLRKSITGDRG